MGFGTRIEENQEQDLIRWVKKWVAEEERAEKMMGRETEWRRKRQREDKNSEGNRGEFQCCV